VAVAVAGFVTRRGLREIAIPLLACVAGGNRLSLGPNTPLVMLTPARGDRDGLLPSASVERSRLPLAGLAKPSAAALVVSVLG
jgi:hypothetical protein